MAYFAKLNEENVVLSVEAVADVDTTNNQNIEDEATGVSFLQSIHGWTNWKKCSYNTRFGIYYNSDGTQATDQTKAFRGSYPGIGWIYNSQYDIFVPPKPDYDSWIVDNEVCSWVAPVAYPTITTYGDNNTKYIISWDEPNVRWKATDQEDPQGSYRWSVEALSWISL